MRNSMPSMVIPRPVLGTPPVPAVPRPERFTLDNGLRVVSVRRPGLPQVSARIILPAGSVVDPADAQGTACLVSSLLMEGTHELSAIDVNERIDSLGASMHTRVGNDFAEFDLGLLSETLDEGLSLAAAVLVGAAFPDRELERVRAEALDALEARLDEPANIADDHAATAVFGDNHPYGRLPIGTIDTVRSLRKETIVQFHHERYRPGGSILVIAGDLGEVDLRERLERAFSGWEGEAAKVTYPDQPTGIAAYSPALSVEWQDAAQGEIRVAGLGLARNDPDWITAAVANYILGGSTITGRLGSNLREDKGWTYGVRSGFSAGVHPGGWMVETAVDAEVVEDALSEIDFEIRRMVAQPVTEEELTRAKEAMVLSLPRAFETPGRIVARLATVEAYGLDHDYWERFAERVQQVTTEDVLRVAQAYFTPERLVRVTVGPNQAEPVGRVS